jgi:nitroimidazol reductase NimA-like FMN-containing flavoprotein (pyridoxamine 5'-phosphate oxidase superfamily)
MSDLMSKELGGIQDTIVRVLERNRLAVLATQRDGQPHASLIAFTPFEGLRFLAFATYRETLKYESIGQDPRVAILVEDRESDPGYSGQLLVLTALGEAIETPEEERHALVAKHLTRHPGLQDFLCSSECEFIRVAIRAYQVVGGIDDVQWYEVGESVVT